MAFEISAAAPGRQEAEGVSPSFFWLFLLEMDLVRPARGTNRSCKMTCVFDPLEGLQLCLTRFSQRAGLTVATVRRSRKERSAASEKRERGTLQ